MAKTLATLINDEEYFNLLEDIKQQIDISKTKAVITVNTEMIIMYYKIGQMILERNIWGSKFINNLSQDLKLNYPNKTGFSITNLKYMQQFAREYTIEEIRQLPVGELSWRSNILLIQKIKNKEERFWYIKKAIENNWGKAVLEHQIANRLIDRQKDNTKKTTNYIQKLQGPFNERVLDFIKDPYLIDYIEVNDNIIERELENLLTSNISKLLLELGNGFCFKGNQYHLRVGEKDYYLDMLFFNTELNCYVVIELKTEAFKPEFTGQLAFYVQAVNKQMQNNYNPTIGILLCRGKDHESVKLSLEAINAPVGVADYKFLNEIPDYLESIMPSMESLEARLNYLENKNNPLKKED